MSETIFSNQEVSEPKVRARRAAVPPRSDVATYNNVVTENDVGANNIATENAAIPLNTEQGANFNIPQIQVTPPNEDVVGESEQEQDFDSDYDDNLDNQDPGDLSSDGEVEEEFGLNVEGSQEQIVPQVQQVEGQVVQDEVGEAEEFELNVEGKGSGAELEGGVEAIEATEVVGEDAAEIGSVVAETSAELGAAVATEAVSERPVLPKEILQLG